jgi:hypothetical protein
MLKEIIALFVAFAVFANGKGRIKGLIHRGNNYSTA